MKKTHTSSAASSLDHAALAAALKRFPERLLKILLQSAGELELEIYLVGGVLRDALTGTDTHDLDLAIAGGAQRFLRRVRQRLGYGALVPLGDAEEDTCRLVIDKLMIDVAGYRGGAASIEADLVRRDFTINAMGLRFAEILDAGTPELIDPLTGFADLQKGLIRACSGAFSDDPLRLLRAYRFAAQLDFRIDETTRDEISSGAASISRCAAERISYELDLIMTTSRASAAFAAMRASGLLGYLVPELYDGAGVEQPPFHHLDVMDHNLQTLEWLERIIAGPGSHFPGCGGAVEAFGGAPQQHIELKWAALLHDVGKPATRQVNSEKQGRITFYRHDEGGAAIAQRIGERLRWSRSRNRRISALISMHMHPFHLGNVLGKEGSLSSRAMLKLCRRAGDQLVPLFFLAMADSLAGQGPDKPEHIEALLQRLLVDLIRFYEERMQPVLSGPKLLTGNDLIDTLGLEPGPEIGRLLEALETAAVAGEIGSKQEALDWLQKYLENS